METLLFIFSICLALYFSNLADRKNNRKYLLLVILIVSLVSGLRGITVGIDTIYYDYAFIHKFPYSWQFEEVGFRAISNFLMNCFHDTRYIFLFFSLVINSLIILRLWDFRKKCSFPFMLFLYSLTFYIDTMNIMRQFVAIAIIFYSTKLLDNKHYILFVCVVLATTLIHTSSLLALLMVLVYLWNSLTPNKRLLLLVPLLFICTAAVFYVINFESHHIANYLSSQNSTSNINITFIYRISIFIFSLLLYKSKKKIIFNKTSDKEQIVEINQDISFKNTCYMYFIGLVLCSVGMFYTSMARLGYYYAIFELVYWGYLVKNSYNKSLNLSMISIYAIYIFMLELLAGGSGVFPFTFNL